MTLRSVWLAWKMIKGEESILGDCKDNCMGYIYAACLLVCLV